MCGCTQGFGVFLDTGWDRVPLSCALIWANQKSSVYSNIFKIPSTHRLKAGDSKMSQIQLLPPRSLLRWYRSLNSNHLLESHFYVNSPAYTNKKLFSPANLSFVIIRRSPKIKHEKVEGKSFLADNVITVIATLLVSDLNWNIIQGHILKLPGYSSAGHSSFNKYLLRAYCMPGTALGSGYGTENKTKFLLLWH